MASSIIRKSAPPLAAVLFLTASVEANTAYTLAAGYVQVNVAAGSLGAVSATLQTKSEHTSNADIGAHSDNGTPGDPSDDTQSITVTGAGWTPGAFVNHLCYVSEGGANPGEEAFLITGNTSDTLSVLTDFDLMAVERNFPSTASITIREGHTLTTLFGEPGEIGTGDLIYLWNGSSWVTYYYSIGAWRKVGGGFGDFGDDIVFPDEGFFIQRDAANGDLTLTFFGDVPGKAQITTITGPGLRFVSSRYPVDTRVRDLGFENLPNWVEGSGGDLVYLWNGSSWVTYYYFLNAWRKVGGGFGDFGDDAVLADSGIFVARDVVSTPQESANYHALPYTP